MNRISDGSLVRRRLSSVVPLLFGACLLLLGQPAHAQPELDAPPAEPAPPDYGDPPPKIDDSHAEEAARLFGEGEALFTQRRFTEAAHRFELANQLVAHAQVLYNAALSWDQAGELARAGDAYRTALEMDGLSAAEREDSERRLNSLRSRLGFVQISQPVGGMVSVAHIERQPIPSRFFLAPDTYEVLVENAGRLSKTSIAVNAGETLRVMVEAAAPPPPPAAPEPVPATPPLLPIPDAPPPSKLQASLGWVSLGLGIAAAGVATYLGVQALDARDTYLGSRNTDAHSRSRAQRRKSQTNVSWGIAGGLAGAGTLLVLTAPTFHFD